MRKYSQEYLKFLRENISEIENNGVKILQKEIPGERREGYLDPYEKDIINLQNSVESTDCNKDTEIKIEELENIVRKLRNDMGFPNYNLNTVEVYTKFEKIYNDKNEVGLWSYYPRNIENTENNNAVVFFHGGGWIGGTTYVVENFCKLIAERANCIVFNVDYSLAPEKPYPNGLNDSYYALKHIYNKSQEYGINKNKIAVAGDSAGGNFAAVVSLKARDEQIPMVALQVLIYPVLALGEASVEGYRWSEDMIYIAPEQRHIINGMIGLGKPKRIEEDPFAFSYLIDNKDVVDPYVSPMLAENHVNLPKTILIGAEFDGLRIQTEYYAKLLKDSGVDVVCYRYKGMTHAFIDKLGHLAQTEDLVDIISEAIMKM